MTVEAAAELRHRRGAGVSEDHPDLWPVLLSEVVGEVLADPAVPAEVFSAVVALTVAIAEDPWLRSRVVLEQAKARGPGAGSSVLEEDPAWREVLVPHGYGIAEYRINTAGQHVILTRIVLF